MYEEETPVMLIISNTVATYFIHETIGYRYEI